MSGLQLPRKRNYGDRDLECHQYVAVSIETPGNSLSKQGWRLRSGSNGSGHRAPV
jgi:hypothetical protein